MRWSVFGTASPFTALVAVSLLAGVQAQTPTDEASEAAIKDETQECAWYNYDPVASQAHLFPANAQPASIVQGDSDAQNAFNAIQSKIPNIQPKGTQPASLMGDFSGFTYDPSDPDCWWTYTKCTTPKAQGIPSDITSMPEPNTLGYGFDDGPNCSHNAFYDFLESKNQKATMYFIGTNVQNLPLQAQRAVTDGHEVCVHTWSHRYMTSLSNEQAFAEFYYTIKMIKLATGVTPTCWRPPFGDVDDRIRGIANALGLTTIVWKYDSNDWRAGYDGYTEQQVDQNYMDLINSAKNGTFNQEGAIMLTHELTNYTMSTAVKYYDQLKDAFKYIVPVGVGYNVTQPYKESNYSQPSFEQYISGQTTVSGGSAPQSSPAGGSSTTGAPEPWSTSGSGSSSGSSSGSGSSNGASSSMHLGALAGAGVFAGALFALAA